MMIIKFITSPDLYAPYLEKLKPTFLPWFVKRSSVHLTATLSNLNRFQIIFALPKLEKCTKQGMQRVYNSRVKDVDELCERLISVWCELDQSVVNHAINEWRRRLSACVDAEGGQFEHIYDCFSQNNNFEMAAL